MTPAAALPSDRSFGITIGSILLAVGAWRFTSASWALAAGAALVVLGLVYPKILRTPNRLWMRSSHLLARFTNPIVTGLLFFAIVMPLGLVMRLFGYDPLRLRPDPKAESYWIARKPDSAHTDLRNPY